MGVFKHVAMFPPHYPAVSAVH